MNIKPYIRGGAILMVTLSMVFGGCSGVTAIKEDKTVAEPTQTAIAAPESQTKATVAEQQTANVGDDLPVSRALVAKMLACAFNDLSVIDMADREITFTDIQPGAWYDKYVNTAFINGIMQGADGLFMPEQPITLAQTQMLLDKLNPGNKLKLQATDETKNKPVSYALWVELYKKFLEEMSAGKTIKETFNVDERVFVVLAVPENNSQLKEWNMITDKGPLTFFGLNMAPYVDKAVRVLQKDGDVIAVLSVESQSPTIKNAFIVRNDKSSVTIFSGGAERVYAYANNLPNAAGKICDITVNNGAATAVLVLDESIDGVVKRTTTTEIEFQNKGVVPVGEDFKIYSSADGTVKWKYIYDIIVGQNMGHFVIRDGKIAAAVITKNAAGGKIRVAISTTGFSSLLHDNVSFTCDSKFTVTSGDTVMSFNAGEAITITSDMFAGATRLYVAPATADGRLQIMSIKRNWPGDKPPSYRGVMEVSMTGRQYNIVNEVDLEQYLWAVVPSEMPSGYGVEASKVQAVTARSYAKNQFYANRFHSSGANIDDSVSCQVYNNIPENDTSMQAVNATKGQCLTYNGQPISANFFSTSSGMTANNGEVWADAAARRFPTETKPYLKAKKQYTGNDYGDLSLEENAAAFFKTTDVTGYDSSFPWFRWHVEMTAQQIAATINATIKDRYNVNPFLIKTLQPDGVFRSKPIDSIGDLKNLEVTKRGAGGNIMAMKVTGTKATVLIMTEYNVRAHIKPQALGGGETIIVHKQDGSTSENYAIMPSAFYTMDKKTDANGNITSVIFYGGGNGHGVGMSQNGVKGLIDAGKSFDEILKHYYADTEITVFE